MTGRPGRTALAWWFGAALGFVSACGACRVDAAAPEAARWVGADAVLYLEVPNPPALLDRVTDDRIRKPLSSIPSVKAALEGELAKRVHDVSGLVAGKLGMSREKALRGLTGGGAVAAVEAEKGQPPYLFLVVTPSETGLLKRASETLLGLARDDATLHGRPAPVRQTEHRGVTGYDAGKVVYAVVKDRLVVADRADTLNRVIDRALDGPGKSGSAADTLAGRSRREGAKDGTAAWLFARADRLREIDPNRFGGGEAKRSPPEIVVLGGWLEAVRRAPWVSASLDWTDRRMAVGLTLPVPEGGRPAAWKGFVPPKGAGAPALVNPPGTVASFGLWRNLSTAWEARTDLLPPEEVQKLAQLDGVAGQFFGGRDFGTGVLGALSGEWRLVVALQDYAKMAPVPDVKLPAFALVIDVKPDDAEFAERLKVAFQSFVGLSNLGAAQSKAPPLELGSETFEGVTIATSRYMPPRKVAEAGAKDAVHTRHNYSPSAVQVGNHFVISSSVGLARNLVKALKSTAGPAEATLAGAADSDALSRLVDLNRERLVMQNMLEKGHDKDQAEGEVGLLASLLRYLGTARLSVVDTPDSSRANLEFTLGK